MNVQELFVDPNPHHHYLNPVIWDDNSMRPEVRSKLLQIAEHFIDYLKVANLKLKDSSSSLTRKLQNISFCNVTARCEDFASFNAINFTIRIN